MTSLSADRVRVSFQPSFFFWITVVMALFVFAGFILAALQRSAAGIPNQFPPVVHLHGITYVSWMTLLVVQSALVNVGSVALHRRFGTFGIALGTAVFLVGLLIWLLSLENSAPGNPFSPDLNYLALCALLGFGVLFTLAIRNVRRPEYHRRLILFATIPLLPPGINRMYQVIGQLDYLPVVATYLTMASLAFAIVVYDWRTLGRPCKASVIGATFVFGQQLLHYPVTHSATFLAFLDVLRSLVHYR